jgi:hypothetical protein
VDAFETPGEVGRTVERQRLDLDASRERIGPVGVAGERADGVAGGEEAPGDGPAGEAERAGDGDQNVGRAR